MRHYSYARRALLLLTAAILIAASLVHAAAPASTAPPKKPKDSGSIGIRSSSSSILFPVQGSVYPNGLYRVTMVVGLPPKPYFLDIDTGSDLTWLNCNAPCRKCPRCPHPLYQPVENKLITCKDPLCDPPGSRDCNDNPDQCDYEISYHDGGSSMGVLVNDAFTFRLANGSIIRPFLAFGCGYDQQGGSFSKPSADVDGVLGIGCGAARSTFLSQLEATGITNRVVGHCLGRKGVGYLFFGDAYIPTRGVSWAPISCTSRRKNKYYTPGQANVLFDKKQLGVIRAVFDSGSSYTYFANEPYQELLSAVKNDVSNKLKEVSDPALPTCWKGPFNTLSDLRRYFKPVFLVFSNKAQFAVPPENYLIVTKQGNACLGILNGTEAGLNDISLIGDISMQDLTVVYDNEKLQIGWAPTSCDRIPNADEGDEFEGGFYQPQSSDMGILTEDHPSYYSISSIGE